MLRAGCFASLLLVGCSHPTNERTPVGSNSVSVTAASSVSAAAPTGSIRTAHLLESCAPWDGAAMELVVDDLKECSSADRPLLSIRIWKGLPLAAGKTYQFTDPSQDGSASRCLGGGKKCELAKSVVLTFDTYEEKSATGSFVLTFGDGSRVVGTFAADKCGGHPLCG